MSITPTSIVQRTTIAGNLGGVLVISRGALVRLIAARLLRSLIFYYVFRLRWLLVYEKVGRICRKLMFHEPYLREMKLV